MPVQKLKDFLNREKVKYVRVSHSPAYTAQEIAAAAHVPGKELAKTVMVLLDDRMAMAVLPANRQLALDDLREVAGAKEIRFATEAEFRQRFPECETGAMPPFGNLYEMAVFVAKPLAKDREISFNAGSHTELIRLAYADFERLVQPTVASFTTKQPLLVGLAGDERAFRHCRGHPVHELREALLPDPSWPLTNGVARALGVLRSVLGNGRVDGSPRSVRPLKRASCPASETSHHKAVSLFEHGVQIGGVKHTKPPRKASAPDSNECARPSHHAASQLANRPWEADP